MDDLALRLTWAMAIAGSVAGLAVWLVRRGGVGLGRRPPSPPALACLETLRLTPQHTLHLVALGVDRYLVACHPAGTQLVAAGSPAADSSHTEGVHSRAATAN